MADQSHFVAFIPFVRLSQPLTVAGVEFAPLRDSDGRVTDSLGSTASALTTILEGYTEHDGTATTNAAVARISNRGWDSGETDFPAVRWAASLLFLAAWATNDYFHKFGGQYVNASLFRVSGQRFTGDAPEWISIVTRRRDGSTHSGGWKHGEFTFPLAPHVSSRDKIAVDADFLAALDRGHAAGSNTIKKLRTALPFVMLANTDDDLMEVGAEAILMGSAFEQLLRGDASSFKLGKKLAAILRPFGTVTVADARQARPGILIDETEPERAAAQPQWWVHRKWIEELYDLRSKTVHRGEHAGRNWAWSVAEHLVMAAFVFPLAVKLLLAREEHYSLSTDDEDRLLAIDALLSAAGWDEETDDGPTRWSEIIYAARWTGTHRRVLAKCITEK